MSQYDTQDLQSMHPFVLCTIKALTNPSLSFIFTCIELMYYMYYTLCPIFQESFFFSFFLFAIFQKKKPYHIYITEEQ